MADILIIDPCMLLFVDETGFRQQNSIRTYGYSMRGMRAEDYQLKLYRESVYKCNRHYVSSWNGRYICD